MADHPFPQQHDEPIPGYRLLERLGVGGFGEVWKVEAPGGVLKALKIVHGDLAELEPIQPLAHQELKGLERVKSVRHPYVMSLDRYDIIDGRLLIVMELADGTLWDRFQTCRAHGLPGIPRLELLARLEEAAEALDLMNLRYQLQHLDIKPQNLFLLCDHLKVGDFGLVKDLEGMRAPMTGGLSALYSAPEMFDGQLSSTCDQYSLAIVYQELLTGKRPFAGANPRQLMLQHLTAAPDVSPLAPGEREAVTRALAKRPEDRFGSCMELIRALQGGTASIRPTKEESPGAESLRKTLAEGASERVTQATTRGLARRKGTPTNPDGELVPAVVIGLGGVGGEALQAFRDAYADRYGSGTPLPHIRLLHLDVDATAARSAHERINKEMLHIPLGRLSHYLKTKPGRPSVNAWAPLAHLRRLRNEQPTTEGQRLFGRLAFVDHYPTIARRLRAELHACVNPINLMIATKRTGLQFRAERPRVYVVAGLAGGTGSGMFLDMAYVARHLLREFGPEPPDVVGVLLVPEAERSPSPLPLANACAALRELQHYSDSRTAFTAWYNENEEGLADPAPPFHRCLLVPLAGQPERPGAALAGSLLYTELATSVGAAAERARAELPYPNPTWGLACQTAGAVRLLVPRRALLQRLTRVLCGSLWQSGRAPGPTAVQERAALYWTAAGIAPEEVAQQLQRACERILGGVPAAVFAQVAQRLLQEGPEGLLRNPDAALQALEHLERWVGNPASAPSADGPGMLEEVLHEIAPALTASLTQRLSDLHGAALGELLWRPVGTETLLPQAFAELCAETLRQQDALRQACVRQEIALRGRITSAVAYPRKGAWRAWHRRKTVADLLDALHHYPTTRYRGLVLRYTVALYQSLQKAARTLPPDFSCCRARLAPYQRQFQDAQLSDSDKAEPMRGRILLPEGYHNISEAAAAILDRLPAAEIIACEERAYGVLGKQLQARAHLCTLAPEAQRKLVAQIYQTFQELAERHLRCGDAAELYLRNRGRSVLEDLTGLFTEAAPPWASSAASEICLLAVPAGIHGDELGALAQQAAPAALLRATGHPDEVLFYREETCLRVAELPQLGPRGRNAYSQIERHGERTCHSRLDILHWLDAPENEHELAAASASPALR
jgi:eukaryotic-like serine/threonine-protein kinase